MVQDDARTDRRGRTGRRHRGSAAPLSGVDARLDSAANGRSDLRGRLELPLLVLLAATAFVLFLACLNVANLYLARGFARRSKPRCSSRWEHRARVSPANRWCRASSRVRRRNGRPSDCAGRHPAARFVSPGRHVALSRSPNQSSRLHVRPRRRRRDRGPLHPRPRIRAARAHPSLALKESSAGQRRRPPPQDPGGRPIALALVVLIGAGLFVWTLAAFAPKAGVRDDEHVLIRIDLGAKRLHAQPQSRQMHTLLEGSEGFRRGRRRPSRWPSCSLAAAGTSGHDRQRAATFTDSVVHCNAISPSFFDTLGVPILAGSDFTERDARRCRCARHRDQRGVPVPIGDYQPELRPPLFRDADPIHARIGLGNRPETRRPTPSSASSRRSAIAVSARPTIRRSSRSSKILGRGVLAPHARRRPIRVSFDPRRCAPSIQRCQS